MTHSYGSWTLIRATNCWSCEKELQHRQVRILMEINIVGQPRSTSSSSTLSLNFTLGSHDFIKRNIWNARPRLQWKPRSHLIWILFDHLTARKKCVDRNLTAYSAFSPEWFSWKGKRHSEINWLLDKRFCSYCWISNYESRSRYCELRARAVCCLDWDLKKCLYWNGTNGGMLSFASLSRNVPTSDIAITIAWWIINLDFGHVAFVASPSRSK